jgi:dienelactone hydrolase
MIVFVIAFLAAMASPVWSQAKKPVQTDATFLSADGTTPAQKQGFKDALVSRNARYAESVYNGVGHAFIKDENVDVPGPARRAWNQVIIFFKVELGVG